MNTKLKLGKSIGRETRMDIDFPSIDGTTVEGHLVLPGKFGKFPLVVLLHDYMTPPVEIPELSQAGFAQLSIWLRGHTPQALLNRPSPDEMAASKNGGRSQTDPADPEAVKDWSLGLFRENITDKEQFYLRFVYADLMVAIHTAKKHANIDGSKISLFGHGIGGAAALYAAWLFPVKSVFAANPSFTCLETALNQSNLSLNKEIKEEIKPRQKTKAKNNLNYFDPLVISEQLECPVGVAVGYHDAISPREAQFGFFNHLTCPKDMQVFADDGHDIEAERLYPMVISFFKEYVLGVID